MTDFGAYFKGLYNQNPDPWDYAASTYERQKYDATCTALQSARYRSGIELGCSVGVLSARLASRCDTFLAVDIAETAVEQAAARLAGQPGASALVADIPTDWPAGAFDLIVLSEVIYYLTAAQLSQLAHRIVDAALPGAECVLVNWRGHTDTPYSGVEAQVAFCAALGSLKSFRTIRHAGTADYDHVTLILN